MILFCSRDLAFEEGGCKSLNYLLLGLLSFVFYIIRFSLLIFFSLQSYKHLDLD
jgi:hypothetical protein